MWMLLFAAQIARYAHVVRGGGLAPVLARASAVHQVSLQRAASRRLALPVTATASAAEQLTGADLDAAIKTQGDAVRALKEAGAAKEEIDAAVAKLLELKAMLPPPGPIVLPTNDNDHLLRIRHTSSHVLAMAVQQVFPEAQVTIGPWIENGFYYDFAYDEQFTQADLKKIKKQMDKIIRRKLPLRREEVTRDEARRRIEALGEPYKLEILDAIEEEPITIYHIGDEWWDLCAGPHVETTGDIDAKAVALESVAGAYWRGDETKAMLQRIYGTAWESKEQLVEYERLQEEAKRRDHRALGKKLGLFSIQPDAGGGLVFWHPRGARVRRLIEDFWKDAHVEGGYELLYTPHVANVNLWKTSGHFEFYKEGMFDQMEVEDEEYQIKPMNCPFHVLVYKDGLRSYRELPLRWAELGTVYRYERSGTLHGLMRVRGFTQDDAHIFCLPEQLSDEILGVLDLTQRILSKFGFEEYEVNLSTRPDKSVGTGQPEAPRRRHGSRRAVRRLRPRPRRLRRHLGQGHGGADGRSEAQGLGVRG